MSVNSNNHDIASGSNSNNNCKQYTSEFKLKAVLESFQRDTTIEAVRRKFGVHLTQLNNWRKAFNSSTSQVAQTVFASKGKGRKKEKLDPSKSPEELTKIIGNLTIENQILKKASESLA